MKRAILCEICKHQTCVLNARLHRQIMTCSVRPGIVAEQVICREFDERKAAAWSPMKISDRIPMTVSGSIVTGLSAYIGNLQSSRKVTK
jgi:hypothetical protein